LNKKIQILLKHQKGFAWHKKANSYAKGYLHEARNALIQGNSMADYFHHCHSLKALTETLRNTNGFFSLVLEHDDCVLAAVDRVRSLPLFYVKTDEDFLISDDAIHLHKRLGVIPFDQNSMTEFLLTGFVTNQETLDPRINQIQAGEALSLCKKSGDIQTSRYYLYTHQPIQADPEEMISHLNDVNEKVFDRLIQFLNGRQAVIPLSGGNDSRIIVQMLKRGGYQNVLCFSYGYRWHWEVRISKAVADHLGYDWKFVPFSRKQWFDWNQSPERRAYWQYGSNLTSMAHLQDWPAVMELKEKHLIDPDAVFVPGHSGDFLGGSHLPVQFSKKESWTDAELLSTILKKHYQLWNWKIQREQLAPLFSDKIRAAISPESTLSAEAAADRFELWDWQERQAKMICNSVRAYEFWGYSWSLPLWDHALLEFWSSVPLSLRLNRQLYLKHIQQFHAASVQLPTALEKRATRMVYRISDEKYGRLTGDRSLINSWFVRNRDVLPDLKPSFINPNRLTLRESINGLNTAMLLSELSNIEE